MITPTPWKNQGKDVSPFCPPNFSIIFTVGTPLRGVRGHPGRGVPTVLKK